MISNGLDPAAISTEVRLGRILRENVETKGRRLLIEGRLQVRFVNPFTIVATCKGTEANHNLSFDQNEWFCSCPARGRWYAWLKGDQLRSDHPAVKRLGRNAFVPVGTPRDEIPSIFENIKTSNDKGGGPRALVPRYLCLKNVRADVDGNVRTAKKGDMLEPNDDLVRIAPESFRAMSVPA